MFPHRCDARGRLKVAKADGAMIALLTEEDFGQFSGKVGPFSLLLSSLPFVSLLLKEMENVLEYPKTTVSITSSL